MTEGSPVVSVLMPIRWFDPSYLRASVASLVQQTCGLWKLLIISERERRSSILQALDHWAADPKLELLSARGGLGAKINAGMRHAETEFVALLFADDLWDPVAVETLLANMEARGDVDFFHSSRRFIDDDGHSISSIYRAKQEVALEDFFQGSPVKHLLCWRRTKGLHVGGIDERGMHGADDLDFPWTMAEHGAVFGAIDECLYIVRDHRRYERLTTHVPLSVQKRNLRRMFRKHGMDSESIDRRLTAAKESYLQQALYRNRLAKRWSVLRRRTPSAWRETYR